MANGLYSSVDESWGSGQYAQQTIVRNASVIDGDMIGFRVRRSPCRASMFPRAARNAPSRRHVLALRPAGGARAVGAQPSAANHAITTLQPLSRSLL